MGIRVQSINVNMPFGIGGMTIEIDEAQQQAAWALYIELATRIAGVRLEPGTGSAREALNSLYSIFDTTRNVLRDAGFGAAKGPDSVGPLAIQVLNKGLRPFLVEWHTKLSAFEKAQARAQIERFGGNTTVVIDESEWDEQAAFYDALERNRQDMLEYVDALARIAGITRSDP